MHISCIYEIYTLYSLVYVYSMIVCVILCVCTDVLTKLAKNVWNVDQIGSASLTLIILSTRRLGLQLKCHGLNKEPQLFRICALVSEHSKAIEKSQR